MKFSWRMDFKLAGVFALSLITWFNGVSAQEVNGPYIIGNSIGMQSIDERQLTEVFNAELQFWPNNNRVTVVMHSSKSEHISKTAAKYYDGSVKGLQRFWLSIVFQGRAAAPVFLMTEPEIISYVQQNPGAIAVLYESMGPENLRVPIKK